MEIVDLISHSSCNFIKGWLNKNCPRPNALQLLFITLQKQALIFFAKITWTISQELSRIDVDFWCVFAHIWQWRHPAVLVIFRLYPTFKVMKNLDPGQIPAGHQTKQPPKISPKLVHPFISYSWFTKPQMDRHTNESLLYHIQVFFYLFTRKFSLIPSIVAPPKKS